MLERMDAFFAARLDGYDEHMRRDIEGASDFYAFPAPGSWTWAAAPGWSWKSCLP